MKDHGPRLSKACINALIADGEISKADVARTKDKLVAAKAKPKPVPNKVANIASEKPRQTVTAAPDVPPILKRAPRPASKIDLVIDQTTYEALLSRSRFLEDPDIGGTSTLVRSFQPTGATADEPGPSDHTALGDAGSTKLPTVGEPEAPSMDPSPERTARRPEIFRVDPKPTPPVAKSAPKAIAEPNTTRLPAAEPSGAADSSRQARGSISTSAGKMSLGKTPSSDPANRQAPSDTQAWDDYMQRRFNGDLNYEGLGAHFSKGP
jgi:hypothetical protein